MLVIPDNVPGARWLRCDLHVHTPFDGEKRFGEDVRGAIEAFKKEKPQRLAEIAERFVDACRSGANGAGVDLVALTDHNSIDGYRYLKPQFEAIAQQAGDQGLSMPVILPGCEFTVGGERPIHFLVIFASTTPAQLIDRAIQHVFGTSDRFDPQDGTPRSTCQSVDDFLKRLFEFCRPSSGDRHMKFVVLPAHADDRKGAMREAGGSTASQAGGITVSPSLWDEMKGHLRQRVIKRRDWNGFETKKPYGRLPRAYQELLWKWAAARKGEDWDKLSKKHQDRYRDLEHWPLVECSDPHNYEAIGARYTWLKMEVPDVEGIRLALLDPESRLRRMADGPPPHEYARIERISIRGTDFLDEIEISFNPSLTTLIGGRGTGKSTVIEYLRYALDRARAEDFTGEGAKEIRENVLDLLDGKQARDHGETPGTLLPHHVIEVDVVVAGRTYRVSRNAEGIEVERDPESVDGEVVPLLDVRELLQPRVLSQRQIAGIARDPASQRSELDALLARDRLEDLRAARRSALQQMERLQKERARIDSRRRQLPARETELQKVRDQIEFLEKEGRQDVLNEFQAFERERHWLDAVAREIETQVESLEDQAAATDNTLADWPPAPEEGPSHEWITSVAEDVQERVARSATILREEASGLRELAQAVEEKRADQWEAAYEKARKAYDKLREEMQEQGVDFSQHEKLLQQRALLEREITELRGLDEELTRVRSELDQARSTLVEVHERRLELRRRQARALEEFDADVRLDVRPFMDRQDLESRREEWFAGAGLQERDWEKLVDYVMADGDIPGRLNNLVGALRRDINETADRGRVLDVDESSVAALLDGKAREDLTGHFFRALERQDRIRLEEMERFLPEDRVEARVRGSDGEFKPITSGSVGQRSTAILSLLLSAGDQPLIIDQPEDDLDNRYVYDVVVDLLKRRKFSRQIIIATHNANIPVNGDAELIVALQAEKRMGEVLKAGSIDREDVKECVSEIMEGSAEAFRLRRERYGF